jgi:hypothetical protein
VDLESNLLIFEGICGAGKSTLSKRITATLLRLGYFAKHFEEGAKDHPASLNGYAFLKTEEYNELIKKMPTEAQNIMEKYYTEDGNLLVRYLDIDPSDDCDALLGYLKSKELCWAEKPVASLREFSFAIQEHWRRFALSIEGSESIYIGKCLFPTSNTRSIKNISG